MTKIVKLSHSILSAWAMKRYEDAVSYYIGRDLPPTPYMELGRLKHELWEHEIITKNRVPEELGGDKLHNPIIEQKYEKLIPLGKYAILLRGTPDCTDGTTIWEWKCGIAKPVTYVDSMQLDYYKLLVPELELGIYRCFNPYINKYSTGVKFLSEANADAALEHIITFGGEMIEYLEANKLLTNYKPEIYEKELALL